MNNGSGPLASGTLHKLLITPPMATVATLARHRQKEWVLNCPPHPDQRMDLSFLEYVCLDCNPHGTRVIFTREFSEGLCRQVGGWNDPVALWHLSLSFFDAAAMEHVAAAAMLRGQAITSPLEAGAARGHDPKLAARWVQAIYGEWVPYVWHSGPDQTSATEQAADIHHYIVFSAHGEPPHPRESDQLWQPVLPRTWKDKDKLRDAGWTEYDPPPPPEYDEEGLPK